MSVQVKVTDNSKKYAEALDDEVTKALEAIGLQAEKYAKMLTPVDTGLLRNSITHALSGEQAAITSYRAEYGSNRGKNGKRISAKSKNAGSVGVGFYSGQAPSETENEKAVYIGTNVEYAAYVEFGTEKMAERPFLKPAATEHSEEYKRIAKKYMQGT